jgi:hypothetical protein
MVKRMALENPGQMQKGNVGVFALGVERRGRRKGVGV